MIERPMPQDIMKFKAKMMMGLTGKQLLCVIIGAVLALIGYFTVGCHFKSNQLKIIISAIPAIPPLIVGFMPIMGMPFEKVAKPMLIDNFIAPAVRKKEIHHPGYEKWAKKKYGEVDLEDMELTKEQMKKMSKKEIIKYNKDLEKRKKNKHKETYKITKSKDIIAIK